MAFNTKVDVADTELEENEAVVAEAEDVTLEDEALVEAESDTDEDDEEADESEDSLTYSNGVIEKIVAMATREVPHVLGMKGNLMHFVQEQFGAENLTKGVTVEVTDDNRVVVNISVIIEYGAYAPAIFDDVKARVTERLAAMTGLEVAGVNLRIEDVITPEEYTAPASTNNLPKRDRFVLVGFICENVKRPTAQAKAWPVVFVRSRYSHTARLTKGCNPHVPRYSNGRIVSKLLTRGCRNGRRARNRKQGMGN